MFVFVWVGGCISEMNLEIKIDLFGFFGWGFGGAIQQSKPQSQTMRVNNVCIRIVSYVFCMCLFVFIIS